MRRSSALVLVLTCLVACSGPPPSAAQQAGPLPAPRRVVPANLETMRLSFAPVVQRAAPAVVNVYSRRVVRTQVDPFWGLFVGIPQNRVEQSLGSGSIVRDDGVILTNHHNIEGAQEIMVVTADRREWPARVLLDDARADLAVLKIDTKGEHLPTIAIDDQDKPQVGDLVLAIGDPFGVGQTVTNGIVSALARSNVGINDYSFFIQTDAAINPGNSGGPLVDMAGDLIGVNTAIVSGSGTSSGVGFAIPAAMAKQVVETALGGGHAVVRPWIGAKVQELTGELAKSMGLRTPQGVVVTEVWPGGPAADAGIVKGDVIVSAGGQAVNDEPSLTYAVGTARPGEALPVVVRHDGRPPHAVTVRIEPPPAVPAPDQRTLAGDNPLSGATVVNLSPAAALTYGVDPFAGRGVVVTNVEGGIAATVGIQPGDFIRAINGRPVTTTAELAAALAASRGAWTLTIERGGRTITAEFSG
ncbi:MAG TPA: Do family serine endopeptidase [Caulobacteraceae bacterium]|nr:Do family serine endopeptidase [Caulobacteraceae bacterium]